MRLAGSVTPQRVLACPSVPGLPLRCHILSLELSFARFLSLIFTWGEEGLVRLMKWAVAVPLHCGSSNTVLLSLRLFKLKKRYRNVLDTMFELLPRMARYCPPLSLQVQAV